LARVVYAASAVLPRGDASDARDNAIGGFDVDDDEAERCGRRPRGLRRSDARAGFDVDEALA
jgi:hypothetical protein